MTEKAQIAQLKKRIGGYITQQKENKEKIKDLTEDKERIETLYRIEVENHENLKKQSVSIIRDLEQTRIYIGKREKELNDKIAEGKLAPLIVFLFMLVVLFLVSFYLKSH